MRVFATRLSWTMAVLLASCVLWLFSFWLAAMEGQTLARAVAMSVAVSWRVVPACPIATHTSLPNIVVRAQSKEGMVFLGHLGEILLASEVLVKADLEDDHGAMCAVGGVGVRSDGVCSHSLGVDDIRGGAL